MDKHVDRVGEREFCWDSYVSRRYIYGNANDPDYQLEEWAKAVARACRAVEPDIRRGAPSHVEISEAKKKVWEKIEDGLLQSWGMRAREALGGALAESIHQAQMHGMVSLLISEWGVAPWRGSFLALANFSHRGSEVDFEEWAECAATLSRHGIDINAKGAQWGMTLSPLAIAMSFGLAPSAACRDEEVLTLLALGSRMPNAEGMADGEPCLLDFALRRGMLRPALKMLDMGAIMPIGESVLAAACVSGNARLAAELVARGFDPEKKDQWIADGGERGGHWASPLFLAKGGDGGKWASSAIAEVFESRAEQAKLSAEVGPARKARAARI